MSIDLSPEVQELVHEGVRSGRFETPEAFIEAAVREFDARSSAKRPARPNPEELESLFALIDRSPPPRTSPLPDEAFDRGQLYSDRA